MRTGFQTLVDTVRIDLKSHHRADAPSCVVDPLSSRAREKEPDLVEVDFGDESLTPHGQVCRVVARTAPGVRLVSSACPCRRRMQYFGASRKRRPLDTAVDNLVDT